MTYLAKLISSVEKKLNCKLKLNYSLNKQCIAKKQGSIVKISLNKEDEIYYLERILLLEVANFKTIRLLPIKHERGLMIDIGRKYYSLEILFDIVDFMAKLGMNYLQLHFSDNEGFRIESKKYPDICSKHYLTHVEVNQLIQYANDRKITIIPELDSPGHLQMILREYQEYRLSLKKDSKEPLVYEKAIDVSNPDAMNFIKSIWKEYLELFSSSSIIHIGADEFIEFREIIKSLSSVEAQVVYDQYMSYINQLSNYIESYGKTVRIWNDGIYRKEFSHNVPLNSKIQVTYWTHWDSNMAKISQILEKGHKIGNFNDNYLYFVLGEAAGYDYPTVNKIQNWHPNLFSGDQLIDQHDSRNLGSYFCIWSDVSNALTEKEVYDKICPVLEAMQNNLWKISLE